MAASPHRALSNLASDLSYARARTNLEARLRAAAGIPAYMRRLRRIEDLEQAIREALHDFVSPFRDNQASLPDQDIAAFAETLPLQELNHLIEHHNQYYPIEANLPVDVRTGVFLLVGKPWHPRPLLTWKDLLSTT